MPARRSRSLYVEKGARAHRNHRAKKWSKSNTTKTGWALRLARRRALETMRLSDQTTVEPLVRATVGNKVKVKIIRRRVKMRGNKVLPPNKQNYAW